MPATPRFSTSEKIPYITSKNIRGGNIDFTNVKYISSSDYLNLTRNRPIFKGDILISMIGTIGEVARVKKADLNFYGQNMFLVRLNEDLLDADYFLHYFDSKNMKKHFNYIKNKSSQGYLKAKNIEVVQIPIPPLTIQKEIVKILNNFTQLEAELEARKKQYEHYREALLSFDDGVEFLLIGEIVQFAKGASIPRDRTSVDYEVPYLHYGDIYKLYNKEVDITAEFGSIIKVSIDERIRENQYIHTGDIVYNLTSETKKDLGKAVVIKNDEDCKFIAGTETTIMKIVRKDIINPCFLNYLLMTFSYLKKFRPYTTGTKVFRVHPKAISKIKIPIPPLPEQKRIVAILDKFDALVNDISVGLPAEISARKKQYEYYRNQLLTFKPLGDK